MLSHPFPVDLDKRVEILQPDSPGLPASILATTLEQFDELVKAGLVYHGSSTPTLITLPSKFALQCRVTPHLREKPMLSVAGARSAANPFLYPDTRLVVVDRLGSEETSSQNSSGENGNSVQNRQPGLAISANSTDPLATDVNFTGETHDTSHGLRKAKHRLMINKYCVYRPQLLVTSRGFESQADDLDADDLAACWAVMSALNRGTENEEERVDDIASQPNQYMMIYNCGARSGNSQPHKHMQIFPQPSEQEYRFFWACEHLKPRVVGEQLGVELWRCLKMPFWHVSAKLVDYVPERPTEQAHNGTDRLNSAPKLTSPKQRLWHVYSQLLAATKRVLREDGVPGPASYNVVLTSEWMTLIPRNAPGRDGLMLNAVGMAGLVWLSRELDREHWTPNVIEEHLKFCGLPSDVDD